MKQTVRIGTRKSELAVKQTGLAADMMKEQTPDLKIELVLKQTTGDRILDKPLLEFGGKGVFVSEFEEALQKGEIDFAVHSAKDLPMELAEGLEIVGVPKRADIRDVVVTRMDGALEKKAAERERIVVGTSSLRRKIQIEPLAVKLWGTEAVCENLRGNVQTRLNKLLEGTYDAVILAAAGLKRLNILNEDSQEKIVEIPEQNLRFTYLDWEEMIPAGCQGILAVEGRKGDAVNQAAEKICDSDALLSFHTERKILHLLNAGCHEPIGVCSVVEGENLKIRGIYQGETGKAVTAYWEGSRKDWEKGAENIASLLKEPLEQ